MKGLTKTIEEVLDKRGYFHTHQIARDIMRALWDPLCGFFLLCFVIGVITGSFLP